MTRIAAVADIHVGKSSQGQLQPLFRMMAESADIILLGGDLTNYGLPEEVQVLVKELQVVEKTPVVAVLGNHDFESGSEAEAMHLLTKAGVTVLDGNFIEIGDVGIAGVKGFAGGFGRRALEPWGESTIKQFVRDAVEESLKLESALGRLRTPTRIALVHYSPIHATVVGEPDEIIPFLGSSRLEEPIDRYRATVCFHGHAHHGTLEGKTKGGVPVFNVAMPLLKTLSPEKPFFLYETPVHATAVAR